jgi:hypothetical protein
MKSDKMLELIDGAKIIIELFKAETPIQKEWEKDWLYKTKQI